MLKKLIVVYNPRSSKHAAVAREVLAPARKLSGWLVGKYEVKASGLHENADELAKILNDGDLVIAAGGDGTAAMAVNGVMRSGKDVALGVLGYGNFNDLARMLKTKRAVEYGGEYVGGVTEIIERYEAGEVKEIYPLEAVVDGKHWRYAPCYLSLGLFAESTAVFDEPKVREKLKTGKKRMFFSIWTLTKWYFRNRKREFLPEGRISAVREVVEVVAEPELVKEKPTEKDEGESRKIVEKKVKKVAKQDDGKNEVIVERKAVFTVAETEGKKPEKKKAKVKTEPVKKSKKSKKPSKIEVKPKKKKKVDAKLEREFEAAKTERDAEKKKFKRLLRAAKKQQLLEMKAGAQAKMLQAGTQTKAKLAVAKTGAQTKLLNVRLKTQDKVAAWSEKAREKREQETPEIIIEGAEAVEQRKKGKGKKNVACAVEKTEKNRFKAGATDYIAVNGPTLAKLMRGGRYYKKAAGFRSTTVRLSGFWRLMGFMACSVLLRVPGKKTRGDVIKFKQRGNVMIQAEGEYEMLTGVKKIVVRKAKRGVKVVEM